MMALRMMRGRPTREGPHWVLRKRRTPRNHGRAGVMKNYLKNHKSQSLARTIHMTGGPAISLGGAHGIENCDVIGARLAL